MFFQCIQFFITLVSFGQCVNGKYSVITLNVKNSVNGIFVVAAPG